ncbi:MAG: type II CAAX endopeptidase family protein [Bacteroidota bacterium]
MFFKAAQQGGHQIWRYLLTIFCVILGFMLGQIPLSFIIYGEMADPETGIVDAHALEEFMAEPDFTTIGVNSNLAFLLVLFGFVGAAIGLWIGVSKIHGRPMLSVVTPKPRLDWAKMIFAFSLWLGLAFVMEMGMYLYNPGNYAFLEFNLSNYLVLILISLLVLPIQTSIEELFVRGYLLQGLGLATKVRWIPLLLTSMFFGMVHLDNPEVKEFGLGIMMTYYISVGLFLGMVTLMDDSLELALGVHLATNLYGSMFVTFKGAAIQTDALARLNETPLELMLPAYWLSVLIFVFICWKKYGWVNWLPKIFGPVDLVDEAPQSDMASPN